MKRCVIAFLILAFMLVSGAVSQAEDVIDEAFGKEVIFSYDIDSLSQSEEQMSREDQYRYHSVAWSPDGDWIALGGHFTLSLIPVEGGTASMIHHYDFDDATSSGGQSQFQNIRFSPDGKYLTYTSWAYDPDRGSYTSGSMSTNFIPDINSYDISSGETATIISGGMDHSWSDDGRYITFINFDYRVYTDSQNAENHRVLAVYDTVTGEISYLTDDNNSNTYDVNNLRNPSFSPDNSHIIAVKNNQLCKIPFEGGEVEYITNFETPENMYYPMYSSDGRWLLFERSKSGKYDAIVYDVLNEECYFHFGKESYEPGKSRPYSFFFEDEETLISQGYSHSGWALGSQMRPCFSPDQSKIVYLFLKPKLWWNDKFIHGITPYITDFDPERYNTIQPTAVEADMPDDFAIKGNFPNPFNPTTTIEFSIPEQGMTTLEVFNMAGQTVRELVAGELSHGNHKTVWDGRDASGNMVSSGIYFARLKAGNFAATRQMMLMK